MSENNNSQPQELGVICPNCHKQFQQPVHSLIELPKDTELKKALLDRSLYILTCPNCKETFKVMMPISYFDNDRSYWIAAVDKDQTDDFVQQMSHPVFQTGNDEMDAAMKEMNEQLTRRVVNDDDSLREKVMLFDAGLDDRAFELVKKMLRKMLKEKNVVNIIRITVTDIDEQFFDFEVYHKDNGELTRSTVQTQHQVYDYILEKYSDLFNPINSSDNLITDAEWADQCGIDPEVDGGAATALFQTLEN
jgi:protein-arginine kinase activator protein McsA